MAQSLPTARQGLGEPQQKGARVLAPRINPPHAQKTLQSGLNSPDRLLILYRFAVAAAGTGVFSLWQAAGTFALIVVGEIAFGIGIGWLSLRLRRWMRDPRVEITLSLLTPYAAFLIPAHLGGSGVLATMTTGLFASWNGPLLIPAA